MMIVSVMVMASLYFLIFSAHSLSPLSSLGHSHQAEKVETPTCAVHHKIRCRILLCGGGSNCFFIVPWRRCFCRDHYSFTRHATSHLATKGEFASHHYSSNHHRRSSGTIEGQHINRSSINEIKSTNKSNFQSSVIHIAPFLNVRGHD